MDQIKQPLEQGLYILHLELNQTQKNNWQSSLWQPLIRPDMDLAVPGGCILCWSRKIPDKKLLLQCQSFGFSSGQISIGSIHEIPNSNHWVVTNKYNLDQRWLEFLWNQVPQDNQQVPEWWSLFYALIQQNPPVLGDWLYGIEGIFETYNFSLFKQQFLKFDQSSCTNITKPVLKVSYVQWNPGVERLLPGSLSWFTGLSLPLHLSKKG